MQRKIGFIGLERSDGIWRSNLAKGEYDITVYDRILNCRSGVAGGQRRKCRRASVTKELVISIVSEEGTGTLILRRGACWRYRPAPFYRHGHHHRRPPMADETASVAPSTWTHDQGNKDHAASGPHHHRGGDRPIIGRYREPSAYFGQFSIAWAVSATPQDEVHRQPGPTPVQVWPRVSCSAKNGVQR